jgi:hypothetical protein
MSSSALPSRVTDRRAKVVRRRVVAAAVVSTFGLAACGTVPDPSASAAPAPQATAHGPSEHGAPAARRIDQAAFRQDMRKLWEDHVTWTRLFIVSAIADLPDVEATAGRLLQNQADIGASIATFYGEEAGTALTDLLREHILVAADLVGAARAGDDDAVTAQRALWYANADEIARFLAAANPAWPFETMSEMMRMHLDQTLDEATARLNQNWEADIAAYDDIHDHILVMADALADGIITQFRHRFSR